MSLQTRLADFITALGTDIKAIRADIAAHGNPNVDPWTWQVQTATVTVSVTAATDIVAMPGLTVTPNTRYAVEALLILSSAATTTGPQFGITGPTAGITRSAIRNMAPLSTTSELINHQAINNWIVNTAGLTTPMIHRSEGIVDVGAAPNNIKLRPTWRTEVAGSAITMYPGSYFRYRVL